MKYVINEYHMNVPDEELLNDVVKVFRCLNQQSMSMDEYSRNGGKYHPTTICKRFGGWINTLEKCGITPRNNQKNVIGISKNELIADLQRVSIKLNKQTFTTSEYTKYGRYSKSVILRGFDSWNNALSSAELTPFDYPLGGGSKNKIDEYKCVEEIERLWIELGRQPTTTDIKKGLSKYSLHVYERRFGSWRKALEFFVSYMNNDEESMEDKSQRTIEQSPIESSKNNSSEPLHKSNREVSLRMRFLVMKRDDFKCCLCGRSPSNTPGLELHIDHILPWAKGGETVFDNLRTLCSDCNLGKGDLLENE